MELTYQGAAILGVIAAVAWIAILWTERKPPTLRGP
jgi:hypothetical protein